MTSSDLLPEAPSSAATPRSSLWRNRDFTLLWAGQAVSTTGTQMTDLALPLLVLALTHSAAQAGLVAACGMLQRLVLALPAGALVDRADRKRVMIVCDLLRAFALASVPVALAFGRLTLLHLCAVALILGGGSIVFFLARISALPRVVPKSQLPAAVARNEAAESAAMLFGPPLAGAIFALGRAMPFAADGLSYLVSAISLRYIRTPFQAERAPHPEKRLWADVAEGVRWLWHAPLVRFMALVYAGFALFLNGSDLAWLVLAQQRGASSFVIGLLFAVGGIGGLVGVFLAPYVQRRFRFGQIIPTLGWVYPLMLALFVVTPNFAVMALSNALIMTNDQIYDVVWPSYRMALIPDELQGRVTSAFRLLLSAMLPVGAALGGLATQQLGPAPTLLICSGGLVALAIAVSLNPHVRHAPPIHSH